MKKLLITISILFALLIPSYSVAQFSDDLSVVVGPYVGVHFLDRDRISNLMDPYGFEEVPGEQISLGIDGRIFLGRFLFELEFEGYTRNESGSNADANLAAYDGLANFGFVPFSRKKTKLYLLAGIGGDRIDFTFDGGGSSEQQLYRYGALANGGVGFDHFFTFGSNMALVLFARAGYMAEIFFTDWSERENDDNDTGNLSGIYVGRQFYGNRIDDSSDSGLTFQKDPDHDFSGFYLRAGIGFGYIQKDTPASGKGKSTKPGKAKGLKKKPKKKINIDKKKKGNKKRIKTGSGSFKTKTDNKTTIKKKDSGRDGKSSGIKAVTPVKKKDKKNAKKVKKDKKEEKKEKDDDRKDKDDDDRKN